MNEAIRSIRNTLAWLLRPSCGTGVSNCPASGLSPSSHSRKTGSHRLNHRCQKAGRATKKLQNTICLESITKLRASMPGASCPSTWAHNAGTPRPCTAACSNTLSTAADSSSQGENRKTSASSSAMNRWTSAAVSPVLAPNFGDRNPYPASRRKLFARKNCRIGQYSLQSGRGFAVLSSGRNPGSSCARVRSS